MKTPLKSLVLFMPALFITALAQPAGAQYIGNDSHESKVAQVSSVPKLKDPKRTTGSSVPPLSVMDGAASGNPIPSPNDATVVAGVDTAGTVRVNNLAMLEALVNIGANGIQIMCLIWGAVLVYIGSTKIGMPRMVRYYALAILPIACGLCTPASVNWAFAVCRDCNLFG